MLIRFFGFLFILGGLVGIYFLQEEISPVNFEIEKRKTFYLPTTNSCKVISLGFYEMYADILWIRAGQFYSEKLFNPTRILDKKGREDWYQKMARCFDIITDLDPYYRDVYDVGKSLLLAVKADDETPLRIMEKGYKSNKKDWRYSYDLGVGYLLEFKPLYNKFLRWQKRNLIPETDKRSKIDWEKEVARVGKEGRDWFKKALETKGLPENLYDPIFQFIAPENDNTEDILQMIQLWVYKLEDSERFKEANVSNYYQWKIRELIFQHHYFKLKFDLDRYSQEMERAARNLSEIKAFVPIKNKMDWKLLRQVDHKGRDGKIYTYYQFDYKTLIKGRKKDFLIEISDQFYFDPKSHILRAASLINTRINLRRNQLQVYVDNFKTQQNRIPSKGEFFQESSKEKFLHPLPWRVYELDETGKVIDVFR